MGTTKRHPLTDQAYQARRNGDRRGALDLYLEAARALDDADKAPRASALRHAGDLYEELGETEAAWRSYEAAWRLYETLVPPPALDLANCRRPMALWKERHGDPATGLVLWRQARGLYEKAAAAGLDLRPAFDECDRHIADLRPGADRP